MKNIVGSILLFWISTNVQAIECVKTQSHSHFFSHQEFFFQMGFAYCCDETPFDPAFITYLQEPDHPFNLTENCQDLAALRLVRASDDYLPNDFVYLTPVYPLPFKNNGLCGTHLYPEYPYKAEVKGLCGMKSKAAQVQLHAYPNPTPGMTKLGNRQLFDTEYTFYVRGQGQENILSEIFDLQDAKYRVIASNGAIVQSLQPLVQIPGELEYIIDLSGLPDGLYYVQVINPKLKVIQTIKVIKKAE
ncbi:MAG: T9SS type A sorting domain-containing protein [Deltaproteobacteria bacterium]|nr:T9SS type A sorting domain-containing protein [Deltaproteobacteria bacterium]